MVAIAASLVLLAFIVLPVAWFRFIGGFTFPLKRFDQSRTQEAIFAIVVCLLPFGLALPIATWLNRPWPTNETSCQRIADYETVIGGLSSDKIFEQEAKVAGRYWKALTPVMRRQGRILVWYYAFLTMEAVVFGRCAEASGGWQKGKESKKELVLAAFTDKVLLRGVSDWHLILTDFTMPRNLPGWEVIADVLTKENVLYKGLVKDHFINQDGELTGLLLQNPSRFDRERYRQAKLIHESHPHTTEEPDKAAYWMSIPSASLYFPFHSISNLNVRHQAKNLKDAVQVRLKADSGVPSTIPNLTDTTIEEVPSDSRKRGAEEIPDPLGSDV